MNWNWTPFFVGSLCCSPLWASIGALVTAIVASGVARQIQKRATWRPTRLDEPCPTCSGWRLVGEECKRCGK